MLSTVSCRHLKHFITLSLYSKNKRGTAHLVAYPPWSLSASQLWYGYNIPFVDSTFPANRSSSIVA